MAQRQLDEVLVRAAGDRVGDVHHPVLVVLQLTGLGGVQQRRQRARVEQLQPLPDGRGASSEPVRRPARKQYPRQMTAHLYDIGRDSIYNRQHAVCELKKAARQMHSVIWGFRTQQAHWLSAVDFVIGSLRFSSVV